MRERILVATNGKPGAQGALRVARALEEERGAQVEVVSLYEPLFFHPEVSAGLLPDASVDQMQAELAQRGVREQVAETGGEHWPIRWEVGAATSRISEILAEGHFHRLLVGIGRHRRRDRWFGSETSLHLIRRSPVPVMAVRPESQGLPRRALLASDFSPFSEQAARAAVEVMGQGSEVELVHVRASLGRGEPNRIEWSRTYDIGAEVRLEQLAREMRALRPDLRFQVRLVEATAPKDPLPAILAEIQREGIDLVAAGSHGLAGWSERLLGSVAMRLLRTSPCSLLLVPPPLAEEEAEEPASQQGLHLLPVIG